MAEPETAPTRPGVRGGVRGWAARLGWFAALWLASVAALAVVAYGIKLMIL